MHSKLSSVQQVGLYLNGLFVVGSGMVVTVDVVGPLPRFLREFRYAVRPGDSSGCGVEWGSTIAVIIF